MKISFRLALAWFLAISAGHAAERTLFEFGSSANCGWKVWNGGFADPADAARQLDFRADGLRVAVDRNRSKTPWPRVVLGPAVPKAPELPADAKIRLTFRIPSGSAVSGVGQLSVIDAQGEKFPFAPLETVRDGERVTATFHVREGGHIGGFAATQPVKGKTSGRNRNDRFDLPLKLDTVSFRFHPDRTSGQVVLERLSAWEDVAPTLETRRPVFDFVAADEMFAFSGAPTFWREGRPATTGACRCVSFRYASFPGPKPVPGLQALEVAVDSRLPVAGTAVVECVNPATGEKTRTKAPWRPVTRFEPNLPHGTDYQVTRLEFWPEKAGAFDFAVRSVTGVWRETEAQAVRPDIDTGNPLHVSRGAHEPPHVTLANTAARPVAVTGTWRVVDFWGRGADLRTDATLAPGEVRRFALPGPFAKGIWFVRGELQGADGSVERHELRFAVLDAHVVEPRWPRGKHFRMGVNYHAGRFARGDRERTMDALAAAGVKLVRLGGYHFSSVMPAEGVYDWAKPDAIMAAGEARGISFDAGLYAPPGWSVDRAARDRFKGERKMAQFPPKPGYMGAYAEAIARRYGTKIDYYELGNEWDLVPAPILPEADAIRLQKEAWEGLKKGCPDAKLMPNGWTSDFLFDRPGMDRKGFQERYMRATKGFYDFHPIHIHGAFETYVERIERFMEQRREAGIADVPWFSNETAITTVNGAEDLAARTVWKKILFAWSMGSVDYIWYNLKATGWVPSDPEQAYGLITADYYPRATYAALSGLIGALQGLDFDARLIREKSRWAFRFKGTKGAFAGVACAGWDTAAPVGGCAVRVKTDAAHAWSVDLFGNRTALSVADGQVVWHVTSDPCALLCDGATFAAPDAGDLRAVPDPPDAVKTIPAGDPAARAPDFVLDRPEHVHDLYEADPASVVRVWKGPSDHAARVWLQKTEAGLRVRAEVTDDVDAPGDDVVLGLRCAGWPKIQEISLAKDARVACAKTREGTTTVYDAVFSADKIGFKAADLVNGVSLTIRVPEDDGQGPDGWLQLVPAAAPPRFVVFQ